jgi:hypothetical protein
MALVSLEGLRGRRHGLHLRPPAGGSALHVSTISRAHADSGVAVRPVLAGGAASAYQ